MKQILVLFFFALVANADDLRISPGPEFSFPLSSQEKWIESALEQLEVYKQKPTTSLRKQLYLVLTSDKNKDLELNELELKSLKFRLMSLCSYYQVYFHRYFAESNSHTSSSRAQINKTYEDFVPGMDLVEPHYNSRYKYWTTAEPSYF